MSRNCRDSLTQSCRIRCPLRALAVLWYDIPQVTFEMVNTSKYRLEKSATGGFLLVCSFETACCPVCGEPLVLRGHCSRGVIFPDGSKVMLIIRRLRCPACGRMHNELPDCLVPYKRFCAEVFENILNGVREAVPCEERTIRRILDWWRVVGGYFLHVLMNLAKKLKFSHSPVPAFKEMVRAAENSNNWIFAHQICTRSV